MKKEELIIRREMSQNSNIRKRKIKVFFVHSRIIYRGRRCGISYILNPSPKFRPGPIPPFPLHVKDPISPYLLNMSYVGSGASLDASGEEKSLIHASYRNMLSRRPVVSVVTMLTELSRPGQGDEKSY
jgi:hypothetical protein